MRTMRHCGPMGPPTQHRGHRGGPGGRRGPRAGRGDVRAAILLLLAEEPRNGYGLMQDIETRTDGIWRPSPGSVYPTLSQLEDEGLISAGEADGAKVFELTAAGRQKVAERPDDAPAPWDAVISGRPSGGRGLGLAIQEVANAATQVLRVGSQSQVEEATKALTDARKALYALLAEADAPEA